MTDAKHLTPHEPVTGSGSPAPAAVTPVTPIPPVTESAPESELLPRDERDKLGLRLQQALSAFVDDPRQAVSEADSLFDDAVRHLTETLAERRRTLRTSWQGQDSEAQTEELRLALRQYRESVEQLLRV
ncbi:hypothetical protein ACFVXC_18715 [Streptomyces sp. NPDC058257]|uniref:hypothetical protein n=1 Tax=Streptomyces sp. NPDC058257 TaxID=3346409 RepID=UPI0036E7D111